jgi:transcriptional regulator with XRE-family HTH domain
MRIMEAIPALKAFREAHDPHLSQQDAAALVGVARETWARWESGKRRVDNDRLPLVSEKTGIPQAVLRPDLARLMGKTESAPAEAAE